MTFFVFDVESMGLRGEGFAVAGGVYSINGAAQWEFRLACPQDEVDCPSEADRIWVRDNIPVIDVTHRGPQPMRSAFWEQWKRAKASGSQMAAEALFPVEARFIRDCIADDASRAADAPYPFHEISSIMLAAGMNPMETYDRTSSERPVHDPLADARQSARLLAEAFKRIATIYNHTLHEPQSNILAAARS